jgi:hypothetical protein
VIGVTISGADDGVDVDELAYLSERFWFVEPRYPSKDWRDRFLREVNGSIGHDGRADFWSALHFCGEVARETLAGKGVPLRTDFWAFDRWQINAQGEPDARLAQAATRAPKLILQCRSRDAFAACCAQARALNGSVLFDPSGGTGKQEPWPRALYSGGVDFGIAGGIGPENVSDAIDAAERLGASWIDMESGVRTDDRFDLDKVHAVLERAARFA